MMKLKKNVFPLALVALLFTILIGQAGWKKA